MMLPESLPFIFLVVLLWMILLAKRTRRRADATAPPFVPPRNETTPDTPDYKTAGKMERYEVRKRKREDRRLRKEARRTRRRERRHKIWQWIRANLSPKKLLQQLNAFLNFLVSDTAMNIGLVALAGYSWWVIYKMPPISATTIVTLWYVLGGITVVIAALVLLSAVSKRKGRREKNQYQGCRVVADCTITSQGGQGLVYGPGKSVRLVHCVTAQSDVSIPYGKEAVVEGMLGGKAVVRPTTEPGKEK